ncbi:hypothetical protein [Synechococcus sp. BS55D]|uniref:hypothetical protein n=1 Tax=Synechococcus sp. BS55D TaxID=2055943 RepID=UPI001F2F32A5|nr:hypothetical protein [Synechococcus sp. BS55D]
MSGLTSALDSMASTLLAMDAGIGLLVAVGISMSASHLFALLANRLSPRQIAFHMLIDALVLSLALTLGILCHSLMLLLIEGVPPQPITLANRMLAALWPGLFYVLVAAPYVSDLISVSLLGWMHLNVLLLLQARYGVPLTEGLLVSAPGFSLALVLIALLFAQRWRASYNTLAKEVGG